MKSQSITLTIVRVSLVRNPRSGDSISFDVEKNFNKAGSPTASDIVTFTAKVPRFRGEKFLKELGMRLDHFHGEKR